MEVLSTEGRRRADIIRNRINYLAEIGAIAPMLGLLGTVIGMIKAFFTLDTRTPGTAALLKDSIAEAMGTTMFGLIVALLAGVFYVIVRGRVTAVLADTEQVCHTVADHVIRAGRSRSSGSSSSSERESKQETKA